MNHKLSPLDHPLVCVLTTIDNAFCKTDITRTSLFISVSPFHSMDQSFVSSHPHRRLCPVPLSDSQNLRGATYTTGAMNQTTSSQATFLHIFYEAPLKSPTGGGVILEAGRCQVHRQPKWIFRKATKQQLREMSIHSPKSRWKMNVSFITRIATVGCQFMKQR